MDNEITQTKEKVKKELAGFLGVDLEDIEDDTTLTGDLHMKATDLTDFMELLNSKGFNTSGVDLTEIETFEEFTDAISAQV